MKMSHSSRIKVGISVALIALVFVFQNGTCDTSVVDVSPKGSTVSPGAASAALAVSPSSQTVSPNLSYQFNASGGSAPYTFTVISGPGSVSATGLYSTSSTSGYATISVRDSKGAVVYAYVTIGTITGGALALTASTNSVSVNSQLQLLGTGGTPPYQYSVLSGGGTINASSGVYTAPANTGTVEIRVVDSVAAVASKIITVVPIAIPTQEFSSGNFTITSDHYIVFTFSNPAGAQNPEITIFGASPQWNAGTNCSPMVASPPCLKKITLSNFNNASPVASSYRGFITMSGRGGSSTVAFCIPYDNPIIAKIKTASGVGVSHYAKQFFGSGGSLMLFSGAQAIVGAVPIDTPSGAGGYTVNVTGKYSVNTSCSDFGEPYMQLLPF